MRTGQQTRPPEPRSWKEGPRKLPETPGNFLETSGSFLETSRKFPEASMNYHGITCIRKRSVFAGTYFNSNSPGVWCLPAHLCGAGSPARVLITRPTSPGGGQVPGTPKNRVVYGVSVHPPGGPSLALEFLALLVTSQYVPPLVLKARPLRNGAGCPMERPQAKTPGTQPLGLGPGSPPRRQGRHLVLDSGARPFRT